MPAEPTISQFATDPIAFSGGALATWGFVMKFIVPRELKALNAKVDHLTMLIEEMRPEINEYRELKANALKEKLDHLPSPRAIKDTTA